MVLVLSLVVGVHARRQKELLGRAVAVTGATGSTWLLADDDLAVSLNMPLNVSLNSAGDCWGRFGRVGLVQMARFLLLVILTGARE